MAPYKVQQYSENKDKPFFLIIFELYFIKEKVTLKWSFYANATFVG